ncbi:hypothetical protein AZ25_1645 [Bordetella holmesii 04P3421]|nr:hypothetical protein AZ25_1645 [Bordetella holmesii 04P3421]
MRLDRQGRHRGQDGHEQRPLSCSAYGSHARFHVEVWGNNHQYATFCTVEPRSTSTLRPEPIDEARAAGWATAAGPANCARPSPQTPCSPRRERWRSGLRSGWRAAPGPVCSPRRGWDRARRCPRASAAPVATCRHALPAKAH